MTNLAERIENRYELPKDEMLEDFGRNQYT